MRCNFCGGSMYVGLNHRYNQAFASLKERVWYCDRCNRICPEAFNANAVEDKYK